MSPLNDNPASFVGATFTNGFSHSRGQPTIKFSIPAQELMLDTKSLMLSGQFIIQNPTPAPTQTTLANRGNYNINNSNVAGGMSQNTQINTSQWNGVASVIDKVVIQSKKTNQELSSVINYSQYDALKTGYMYNEDEYKQVPLIRNLCAGGNHGVVNRHLNNNPEITSASNNAMFDNVVQNSKFYGQFFSIPIDVALLQNQSLFLSNNYTGGLIITLHLNNESSVFSTRFRNSATAAPLSALDGTTYTLKNVKLEGKYLSPTPEDISSYQPNVLLNSRQNLINDLVSTENSSTYTPQLQMVKGIVNVYNDDDQTNNFNQNQYNFRRPVGLVEYQQAKNNVRFPQDFTVKSLPNTESVAENTSAGAGALTLRSANAGRTDALLVGQEGIACADVEARLLFMKSLMGRKVAHHSATLKLSKNAYGSDFDSETASTATNGTGSNVDGDLMGIGADYTNGIGMVQNYVNQDYELRVKSGVNSLSLALPSTRNNRIEVQETFLRNFSQMNLQSLQKVM
tara:strand:+ start:1155 stop:2693 length:1539 start_codon:yes stop_codon:yes gene_type:complete